MTRTQHGFTLIELVLVMLVSGILAVTIFPKLFRMDTEQLRSQTDSVLALLRQAQLTSMQHTAATGPQLQLSSSKLQFVPATAQTINFPNGAIAQVNNGAIALPVAISFDSWGRPQGSCAAGCTLQLSLEGEQFQICLQSSGYISPC